MRPFFGSAPCLLHRLGAPGDINSLNFKHIVGIKRVQYSGSWVIEKLTAEGRVIPRTVAIWRRIEPTRDEIAVSGSMNPPTGFRSIATVFQTS